MAYIVYYIFRNIPVTNIISNMEFQIMIDSLVQIKFE